jgi:hypothetical protein
MQMRGKCGKYAGFLLGVAALASLPALALGHGSYGADAKAPEFNEQTVRLVGTGRYVAEYPHRAVRVRVCLKKLYNDRFFRVKCRTRVKQEGRVVRRRVGVPGCVSGVWQTTALGQARGRDGEWNHTAFARSATTECP